MSASSGTKPSKTSYAPVRDLGQEFTVTQLWVITGHGGDSVITALTVLEAADLIETRREGNKRLIKANRDRI